MKSQMAACASAFGKTRSTRSVVFWRNGGTESFWKISEKGASAPLRALARFKSAKKGRRDAEDAEACVVGSVITLPPVVSLVIALSFRSNKETAKR